MCISPSQRILLSYHHLIQDQEIGTNIVYCCIICYYRLCHICFVYIHIYIYYVYYFINLLSNLRILFTFCQLFPKMSFIVKETPASCVCTPVSCNLGQLLHLSSCLVVVWAFLRPAVCRASLGEGLSAVSS